MWQKIKPYKDSIVLLTALLLGGLLGVGLPELALKFKPLGQIFLNLLFMIIVPLVAISVTSSIARMTDLKKLGALLVSIMAVSIVMAIIPAVGIIGLALFFVPSPRCYLRSQSNYQRYCGDDGFCRPADHQ